MMNRIYRNSRLIYLGKKGDSADFWSSHWDGVNWRAWLDNAKNGGLGYFNKPFVKYLPKQGRILEAGCGVGHIVVALRARGYEAEGVEFSRRTVAMVKEYLKDCPIRVGDVRNLDYPDQYFSAYVSIGVMEHFEEGPERVLEEAYRVLKPGGRLLVSVPRIHAVRRLKIWLGFFSKPSAGDFYQYAFKAGEFGAILRRKGFLIDCFYYYDPVKGVKDEVGLFRYFYKRNQIPGSLLEMMQNSRIAGYLASHMVMLAARRVSDEDRQ